ncbi:class I SAM-dependent methyltransferase [Microvirga pudoricolor]|uniref:class I SAM-dependent methyltransferase n=1 Tax=Microvirga pudoricolor TaxID=2778729 RepID=UPI00194E8795|nr:methyltransferase domain-containing protein [Microvirga pudoricolor]MBM6596236.1 methyltransferase domain-containing protein [Microvirga pudoricolor]
MPKSVLDERYYEVAKPKSLAERILITARDRVYEDFIRELNPIESTSILDVGISDVLTDGANVLERLYPHRSRITACGLGEAEDFQAEFPEVSYVRIEPNRRLPFNDRAFDIATSNAVLEHVGSEQNQRHFVSELSRVAEKVFISVPHRYFPIEHHTGMPFLHWFDRTFDFACRALGKAKWAQEEELILMSSQRLKRLVPEGRKAKIGFTGIPLGPVSSNLYLVLE